MFDVEAQRQAIEGWKAGDRAAGDRLVRMNERAIGFVVRPYVVLSGVDHDDLMQEGRIAVLAAAKKDDGRSFIALVNRVVNHSSYDFMLWDKSILSAGHESLEIAAGLREVRGDDKPEKIKGRNVRALMALVPSSVSLDAPVHDSVDEETLGATLPGDAESPEACARKAEQRALADRLLGALPKREREILERRYLVDEPETHQQIGESMGVTKQRILQIEIEAIAKMRVRLAANDAESVVPRGESPKLRRSRSRKKAA